MSAKRTDGAITDRRAATIIGVLYIVGTASGVLGMAIMPSFAAGTDILAQIAAHRTATVVGALLVLTMGFALSALPAVFYPIGRRFSEVLSMGYVIFRGALEGMTYVISAFIWLVLIAMSAAPSAAAAPVAAMLQTAEGLVWEQLIALPFVIGALMFYWLLFRARLVPRWLSIWGLVGAVFYLVAPLARMAGLSLDFLMFPLAVQEMVLAIWLIAKGFSPGTIAPEGDRLPLAA
ncbi:MAG: DUF4386 domain-containing protein [Coriobacteriia bacterium]